MRVEQVCVNEACIHGTVWEVCVCVRRVCECECV
jgi:hypothetical protein